MKFEQVIEEITSAEVSREKRNEEESLVVVVSRKLFYSFPEEFTKDCPLGAGFFLRGHRVIVTHGMDFMSVAVMPESLLSSLVLDIRADIHSAINRSISDSIDRLKGKG